MSADELDRQRYERIIAAAIVLFGQYGYNGTRIDRICSEARVSTRHCYEQFDSRVAVLAAVHDQCTATLTEEMRAALTARSGDLGARFGEAIRNTVFRLLSEPDTARIVCIESVGVSPDMEDRRRAAMRETVSLIRRYAGRLVRRGDLPDRDYHLIAVGMVGLLNELIVEWLAEPAGVSAQRMADSARDMSMAMLRCS